MRTSVLLVLLGLIAGSLAAYTVKKVHPFKLDAEAVEKEVPAANVFSFADILALFQSKSTQSNASGQITEKLEGLKAKLIEEHQQHLALYAQQREQCAEELSFRTTEISDAQSSLDNSNSHRQICEAEATRANTMKDLAAQSKVLFEQQIDNLNEGRANQIALYNTRKQDLEEALHNIDIALDYLNEFELKAEGILPAQFVQMVNVLLEVSIRTHHPHMVAPIYSKLLQSHSRQHLDYDDISDVRGMIEELKANIQSSQISLDNQEAADKDRYDHDLAELNAIVNKLAGQVADSDIYMGKMNDCVTQEVSIETMAKGKIDRNTELKAQAETICNDADAEFQQAERARTNQIELLGQLESAIASLEAEYESNLFPDIGTLVDQN